MVFSTNCNFLNQIFTWTELKITDKDRKAQIVNQTYNRVHCKDSKEEL